MLRRLQVVLVVALGACAAGPRPVLKEYLPQDPRRELGHATYLAAFSSDELSGDLSADGRQLLYASDQKGQLDIWRKNLATGEIVRVTKHPAVDTQPTWSPDGKSLVFVSMRKDAKGDLYRWREGKLERLSDSEAMEAFPRYGPDGTLFYARGAVGRTRIERRAPGAKAGEPLTRWGATHPAVSADGRYLAFTWTGDDERARVVVQRLVDRKTWVVTTADYGAGFPTFSPDGRHLAFVRFYRGAPRSPRSARAKSSLWRVPLASVVAGRSAEGLMAAAEQMTSDAGSVLLARWHRSGIVFTGRRVNSLDVGILPAGGIVPRLRDAAGQLALAREQRGVWDRLLCLRAVRRHGRGAALAAALHQSARLFTDLGQFAKAEQALSETMALPHAPYAALARLDSFVLPVAREAEARRRGLKHRWRAAVHGALAQLSKPLPARSSARVRAHHAILRADMLREAGKKGEAIAAYEALRASEGTPREIAARATFSLGELYTVARSPELLARYYLTLFQRFPRQRRVLERAAEAAVRPFAALSAKEQIARLRALADQHRGKRLFVARVERRLARLYEKLGKLDLAVAATARVVDIERDVRGGGAAFELGRLSLRYSNELRAKGRASEAMSFYARALAAYEAIIKGHEPASESHARAKREYRRLALLEASQLRRQGDLAAAEKRYRRILTFDDGLLPAHRELIRVVAARGGLKAIARQYQRRLARDAGDFVANYAVGYLATLGEPDAGDLRRAQKALERARSLRPRSPFPQMTLGWIFEMRERYLGIESAGWLEEAIGRYERAYALNDAKVDPQTESDLLVNLANAFVALGSDWKRVHQYCARRAKLGYPLRSPAQEAYHLLSCGRASSAVARYREARDRFERALELGARLSLPRLEAQLVARLALNEHLRGDYVAADALLRRALKRLRALGQDRSLSGLMRTVAYNLVVAGRKKAAREALGKAGAQLEATGALEIGDFISVGAAAAEPSTAPFGFDAGRERRVQLAIREISLENDARQREALVLQERRLALALQQKGGDEQKREALLLRNRVGLAALDLDDPPRFIAQLDAALAAARKGDAAPAAGPEERSVDAPRLALELGLLLNAAEGLARLPAHTHGRKRLMRQVAGRLRSLEDRRSAAAAAGKPVISARLRLACWSELAALSLRLAVEGEGTSRATATKGQSTAAAVLGRVEAAATPWQQAVRWLRRVVDSLEGPEPPVEPSEAAEKRLAGVSAALWRPLGSLERERWYVRAVLRLGDAATAFAPRGALWKHPTTALLQRAAKRALGRDLGALRFALASELAYRRGDLRAARLAVDGLLGRSPFSLGPEYALSADGVRERVFGRALALALEKGAAAKALVLAEQAERRAFVDDLSRLSPRGSAAAAKPMGKLLAAAAQYQEHYLRQDEAEGKKEQAAWFAARDQRARRLADAHRALNRAAPAVGSLFAVVDLPLREVAATLMPGEAFAGVLTQGDAYWLYRLGPKAKVSLVRGARPLSRLRSLVEGAPQRAAKLLGEELSPLVARDKRLRVDFGRIDGRILPAISAGPRIVGRLTSLWQALDARRVRRVALAGKVRAPVEATTRWQLEQKLQGRGLAMIASPLRFDGLSAANLAFDLPLGGEGSTENQRWRLAFSLGAPLLADVVVVRPTAGALAERRRRVALSRLLHAAGVATILPLSPAAASAAADRISKSWPELEGGTIPFGEVVRPLSVRRAAAKKLLKPAVFAGARALNAKKRDLAGTVFHLERALRLMDAVGERKFEDGALRFLTSAYTFQRDFPRALRHMQRLLSRREAAVKAAKPRKRLAAQAKLVKALQRAAWLLLRAKRYDEALKANARAISIYQAVKRPLMARAAYEQRSIICAKKGDKKQALRYANKAFSAARTLAERSKKDGARVVAAEAATTVARLLRRDFARYRAAEASAKLARSLLPTADISRRVALEGQLKGLLARAPSLKDKAKLKAAKKRAKALRGAIAGARRVARIALDIQLELIRVQSARGVYGEAVALSRAALRDAAAAALPADQARLELVNNLYYSGDYGQALKEAAAGMLASEKKPLRQVQFLNAKGTTLSRLGRVDEALQSLRRALTLARRVGAAGEVAATQNNIGDALRAAGRFAAAREAFSNALAIDRRRADKTGMVFGQTNRGVTEALMGRDREARRTLEGALRLARHIDSGLNQFKALAALAVIDLRAGRVKEALVRAKEGRKVAREKGDRLWLWRFELLAARAHVGMRQSGLARAAAQRARKIVAAAPPRPRASIGAARVWARPGDVYDLLIDLAVARKDALAVHRLIEELRGRALKDRLARSWARLAASPQGKALDGVARADAALEAARSAALRRAGKDAAAEIKRLERARVARVDFLAAQAPRLLNWVVNKTTSPKALQEALRRRKAVLLSLYATPRQVIALRFDGEKVALFSHPVTRRRLSKEISGLRRDLLHYRPAGGSRARLHRWLLAKPLQGVAEERRLLLVTSGVLAAVPYAALKVGGKALIEQRIVSHVGSLASVVSKGEARRGVSDGAWVSFSHEGDQAAPLPFTARESSALGRTMDRVEVFQLQRATRDALLSSLGRAQNLHLATHHRFDGDDPLSSEFALHDGAVKLSEVVAREVRAPLVVLSTCNGGSLGLAGAAALHDLPRAFIGAGAGRVVSSLWRISDLGAALLAKYFFRHLASGRDVALALREAQRELAQRYPHPAFWAGLRLYEH